MDFRPAAGPRETWPGSRRRSGRREARSVAISLAREAGHIDRQVGFMVATSESVRKSSVDGRSPKNCCALRTGPRNQSRATPRRQHEERQPVDQQGRGHERRNPPRRWCSSAADVGDVVRPDHVGERPDRSACSSMRRGSHRSCHTGTTTSRGSPADQPSSDRRRLHRCTDQGWQALLVDPSSGRGCRVPRRSRSRSA